MKVATVGYLHGSGGAERQIIMLSNALASFGNEVHLLALAEYKSPYKISDQVIFHDLTAVEQDGFSIWKRYKVFRREISALKPDIIVNYNLQSVYFSMTLPKSVRGAVVYSERGDPYDDEYTGLLALLRSWSLKRTDGFVFQSEGARDFFDKKIRKRSVVIHNPVSVPAEQIIDVKERTKRIVNVGRLHPQKNQKLLIDSFSIVHHSFPDYILEIYGDGELKEELLTQIGSLGLQKCVKILPSTQRIFEAIRDASVFVLSSDYEGMPNALMEAMALGLPCVSTDCRPGGARTLIKNGYNGFIVPCRDAQKLAEGIMKIVKDNSLAENCGREARKLYDTHQPDLIFGKWNEFLESLL